MKIYASWYEATMSLRKRDGRKWLHLYDTVIAHALGEKGAPTYDDPELAELWSRTKVRQYSPGKMGYIKLSKRGGSHGGKE